MSGSAQPTIVQCGRLNTTMIHMSFFMNFIAILVLFVTANMAIVYLRDQLLSFRPSSALLNHHSRLTVSQLGLYTSLWQCGCRAGQSFFLGPSLILSDTADGDT